MGHVYTVVQQEADRLHERISKASRQVQDSEYQVASAQETLRKEKEQQAELQRQLAECEAFLQHHPKD